MPTGIGKELRRCRVPSNMASDLEGFSARPLWQNQECIKKMPGMTQEWTELRQRHQQNKQYITVCRRRTVAVTHHTVRQCRL